MFIFRVPCILKPPLNKQTNKISIAILNSFTVYIVRKWQQENTQFCCYLKPFVKLIESSQLEKIPLFSLSLFDSHLTTNCDEHFGSITYVYTKKDLESR